MNYLKTLFLMMLTLVVMRANAQDRLLWIQQPAISPDGQWIAFEYKGNIYKVPSIGGAAVPLTINKAYNGYPVWSHDGSHIAFASDRYGNFDVFIIPSCGGEALRLTCMSSKDIPYDFSPDNRQVYFGTNRHDIFTSVRFPDDRDFVKLYRVSAAGGKSIMVNSAGTEYVHFNKAGNRFLFQDVKGHENAWRKHHVSPITRDIWMYDLTGKTYTRLTDFAGEDREPVWGDGGMIFYLSERNGNQNLYRSAIDQPTVSQQLTNFDKNPVRNLSRAENGVLAFTQNGELYTLAEGKTPQKISVSLSADFDAGQVQELPVQGGVTEMAISADGKQVAFVSHGEIFVTSATGTYTKRITNTPYQERMVSFGSDGRSLMYSVEQNGSWDIYRAVIANSNEGYFYSATTINTESVIATAKDEYQGVYSPDGKSIAYLEDRNILKVYNLESKKFATILPEGMNFSYKDGDQQFSWSPDSKSLLVTSSEGVSGRSNIILAKADGTETRVDLTKSGFDNFHPQWGMGGKMIYYFSDRLGFANLANGSESDVYAMFFDQGDFDRYQLSKEELALLAEQKKLDSVSQKADKTKLVKVQDPYKSGAMFNLRDRTRRLTLNSAMIDDAILSPDGETLYFLARFEKAMDLWVLYPRTHEVKLLVKLNIAGGDLKLSVDGKTLFLLSDGHLFKVNTENGNVNNIGVNTTINLNALAERTYMLEHAYQLVSKKFFDPNLQGINWKSFEEQYKEFLPHINNNYDFEILLSEFLGELNSSHTGGVYRPDFPNGDQTAALGLLYDESEADGGLKVVEILKGGPFDTAYTDLKNGFIIDKIDGINISAHDDWTALLNHKAGKNIMIGFHDPGKGTAYQEVIKPVALRAETDDLLYNRWIRQMERLTDSLSGGKIGYVHVREMDEESLRATIDKSLGKYTGKTGIVIDTRFNPGGNIHEPLTVFLTNFKGLIVRPQSHTVADAGSTRNLNKSTCVLMNEANYSDGFNFPYLYKANKIGKLIGMPVAGTGTGVWWEKQIDPTLTIGVPEIGLTLVGGNGQLLENHQLNPDIKVQNDYKEVLSGRDQQLEAAVKELLGNK